MKNKINSKEKQNEICNKHNYKKEVVLLERLDTLYKRKNILCDHIIDAAMKHRTVGNKIIDKIKSLVLLGNYKEAEIMLLEIEDIVLDLRENKLLKQITKEIQRM
ncbi:MAG: hypothetical protein FWG85_01045 [Bacteroidetes bacterium]|nr:hypothetical protein [Bacteroidota bacterium]